MLFPEQMWHSTSPQALPNALPKPYPLLVLPGDATQARVELQVLLGCQLIKERVKLGAVAQALLDLQELLQDAVRRTERPKGEGMPGSQTAHRQGWPSRMQGCTREPQGQAHTAFHGKLQSSPHPIHKPPPARAPIPVPINKGLSSRRALIPGQHLEGGCLPRTIDTQQPEALPWPHTHTQPVHSQDAPDLAGLVHLAGQGRVLSPAPQPSLHPLNAPQHPCATPLGRQYLGEVLNLQHVVVSIATQDAVPLVGHIDVIFNGFGGDREPPVEGSEGRGGGQAAFPHLSRGQGLGTGGRGSAELRVPQQSFAPSRRAGEAAASGSTALHSPAQPCHTH